MEYGERLKLVRKRAGLSQEELSALTNGAVKQGTISKIERGGQETSTFDIELADVLNIHPKWLKDEDPRYAPEWLNNGGQVNDNQPGYSGQNASIESRQVAKNNKELMVLTLFREMADFQQDEWLAEGKAKVELHNKFIKSSLKSNA